MNEVTEPSSSSKDDSQRRELLWNSRQEELIMAWRALSAERCLKHSTKARNYKFMHRLLAAVGIIVPASFSAITQYFPDPWLLAVGFIFTATLNGLQALFKWNTLLLQHNEFAAKYEDFGREIDSELIKPKSFRLACDVFTKVCEMKLNFLTRQAPDI